MDTPTTRLVELQHEPIRTHAQAVQFDGGFAPHFESAGNVIPHRTGLAETSYAPYRIG